MKDILHKLVTDSEITLWWEKLEYVPEQYQALVDGKLIEMKLTVQVIISEFLTVSVPLDMESVWEVR